MSFFREKGKVDFITLPMPDNTISFFQTIKNVSEKYWSTTRPNKNIYGFQIQEKTTWKHGLSDVDLQNFQDDIGLVFPEHLSNFYKVMNGLSKPGINLYGSDGAAPAFSPVFYSYPSDIHKIKELMEWIYKANSVSEGDLSQLNISRIFPICWHRFMLIDIPGNPILSIYGDDVVYWADDLSKLLANELFENIYNVYDFENVSYANKDIGFWLDGK